MTFAAFATEKYVRLTTFTKDSRPKHTPVWIVAEDNGTLATTTDDDSWKVKRIRRTPRVEVMVSDSRGNVTVDATTYVGEATIVGAEDPAYLEIEARFLQKYGLVYRLFRFIRKLRRKTPCGILIKLAPEEA